MTEKDIDGKVRKKDIDFDTFIGTDYKNTLVTNIHTYDSSNNIKKNWISPVLRIIIYLISIVNQSISIPIVINMIIILLFSIFEYKTHLTSI